MWTSASTCSRFPGGTLKSSSQGWSSGPGRSMFGARNDRSSLQRGRALSARRPIDRSTSQIVQLARVAMSAAARPASRPLPRSSASTAGAAVLIAQKILSPPPPSTSRLAPSAPFAWAMARSNGASSGLSDGRNAGRGAASKLAGGSPTSISSKPNAPATTRACSRSSPSREAVTKLIHVQSSPLRARHAAMIEESRPPERRSTILPRAA